MIGQSVAHYEITDKLGAGGMGEVYRATDTRLNRQVALKVLPPVFAQDEQRMGRFEREAQVLASLNHPNIASIYGLEESNGTRVLVMELVEGEDLSERIARGPIPLDEALPIARQVAEALEDAHEKGIIHRDLKPANIKLTPEGKVKVLDFGLAKALEDPVSKTESNGVSRSPTLSMAATQAGMILGTAAYMSPEQARGKAVDKRTDIWSFGAVLYEMVTGKRPFRGEDLTETLASVVKEEADLSAAPAKVRRLLSRCLEKDPKKRLRDIGDVWELLEEPAVVSAVAPARSRLGWLPWAAAGVLAVALGIALWAPWRGSQPVERPLMRLNLDLPGFSQSGLVFNAAISADGRRIVYVTTEPDGIRRLATRLLSEPKAQVLPGTENALGPTFSPDGQWIAFWADSRLKKVSVRGGSPLDLAGSPGSVGASWGQDGFLIAGLNVYTGLARVPESGGEPEPLQGIRKGATAYYPQILPGGKAVLYGAAAPGGEPQIQLLTLATGEVTTLVPEASLARFLPTGGSTRGHLVYLKNGTLFAASFDATAGKITGQTVPVLEDVGAFTASPSGSLLYRIATISNNWPVRWLGQDGKTEPLLETRGDYSMPAVSPDGRLLALTVDGDQAATRRVIVYDWNNDVTVPLTQPGEGADRAVWSPDSKHLAFTVNTGGRSRAVWKRADGGGGEDTLLEGDQLVVVTSISRDGEHLAFMRSDAETGKDLWVAPLDLSNPDQPVVGKAVPLLRSPGVDYGAKFSPNGKWIAYASDRPGQWTVYVQPFPGPGEPREIAAGNWPQWSKDGKQLLLLGDASRIEAVDFQENGDAFVTSRPRLWSKTPIRQPRLFRCFAVHPDGRRIAMFPVDETGPDQTAAPRIGLLLNFFDELRRRAPLD
jgi:Tol biopolymer transport system component